MAADPTRIRVVRVRLVRLMHVGRSRHGVVDGDRVVLADGNPFGGLRTTTVSVALERARLLAPVEPSTVYGMAANSREDVSVTPLAFLKPAATVIGPDETIKVPDVGRVEFEAECAAVIGRSARHVSASTALEYVLGYTCANDVTARDVQASEPTSLRAKGYETFTPLGPWVETELDPHDLGLRGFVNGELVQDARTSQLARQVEEIIAWLSSIVTLQPGDVVLTGAPGRTGAIVEGDVVEIKVEGIGRLRNPVREGA